MKDRSDDNQRSLLRGNYQRGPDRGRKMREPMYRGTCKGCPAKRDGVCIFTGLVAGDRDACRAPRPVKSRKRRKGPAIVPRILSVRCDVSDLVQARHDLNMSGRELASRVGISYSFLRDLESGLRPGSIRTFARWLIELEKAKGEL